MKAFINLGLTSIIIAAFIFSIFEKEQVISDGDTLYLALAPLDPRSIMQGDFMRLRYEVEQVKIEKSNEKTGYVILQLDERNVGTFAHIADNAALKNNEVKFKITRNSTRVKILPNSFLFQQGLRDLYQPAKYGIFKVKGGEHLLVGLADGDLNEIKPPETKTK